MHATLDVPDGDVLLAWASDPHRRQAASLVFKNAAGGAALETLVLKAAFCVSYQEEFVAGDATAGAYVLHLVLSDPDGFTMQAGGPGGAFMAPMAREHGVPGAAILPAGGFGPVGFGETKGIFSGRPYNTSSCGGPIQQLSWENVPVTIEGLSLVERHVIRFGSNPENTDMIARLKAVQRGEIEPTEWDKRYYTHELREFERYRNLGISDGMEPGSAQEAYRVWNDTHTATLEDYQLADYDATGQHNLYHPDIANKYDLNR